MFLRVGFNTTTIIPASILANNWFIEKLDLTLSIVYSGLGIGGSILSPIITTLIVNYSWNLTYLIYTFAIAVIVIPVSVCILRFKLEEMGLQALGSENIVAASGQDAVQLESDKVKLTVNESLRKPFFILLILGGLGNGIANNSRLGQFHLL